MPRVTNRVSDEQIAGLAAAQGLSGRALTVAVAVALAESGGDASVNGPNVTTNWGNGSFRTHAVGLCHILLRPGRPTYTPLRNPTTNAQLMKKMSNGEQNKHTNHHYNKHNVKPPNNPYKTN